MLAIGIGVGLAGWFIGRGMLEVARALGALANAVAGLHSRPPPPPRDTPH